MTPWDSDWAGGTEGSDIRIAKEYSLDVRKINDAKALQNALGAKISSKSQRLSFIYLSY